MATLFYHTCGYPIRFETRSTAAATVAIFRDGAAEDGEDEETIEVCPGCGEILLLGDLTVEPREEW